MLAEPECPSNLYLSGDAGTRYGISVAGIGDIGSPGNSTPDGYDDFIVGQSEYDGNRGRCIVYSGKDTAVIWTHTGHGLINQARDWIASRRNRVNIFIMLEAGQF